MIAFTLIMYIVVNRFNKKGRLMVAADSVRQSAFLLEKILRPDKAVKRSERQGLSRWLRPTKPKSDADRPQLHINSQKRLMFFHSKKKKSYIKAAGARPNSGRNNPPSRPCGVPDD